jgi:hypothetical protein
MTARPTTTAPPAEELPESLLAMGTVVDGEDIVDAELVTTEPPSGVELELHDGHRAPIVADDDWSHVDDGDLSPSTGVNIPLIQLNRKSDGGFLNEDTGEVVRELDAVLMAKVNTRAWWPEPFGKGETAPSCRSDDNVTPNVDRSPAQQPGWEMPAKGEGAPPARTCAECPNSKWDGDNPPPCTESIEFLAFVPTDESAGKVSRLRFSGMALSKARQYWDGFKLRMPKRPPMAFITHIELKPEDTPNGTFLVPQFRRAAEIGFGEARPIIEVREQRQLEWRHAVATDERPTFTEAEAGPFDGPTPPSGNTRDLQPGEEPF